MPRFRQIAQILKLMDNKQCIRNLGIIAHIDHGKTTLTDSLLAGTGLLSPQIAGSAKVLDYLKEEQKRGITMKTANISLLYQTLQQDFIINLVDTPGHVDFTGKVTRALRSIDGAVVLVDAVEEVMAQTEIVLQQALQERVRPVLFINKVDKLITELKLGERQIEDKFNHIIGRFNDLIELFADPQFKNWKVNPAQNNVVFGSALHRWGFTLNTAQQKRIKFSNIIKAYQNADFHKLSNFLPLHIAILDMAVNHIPNSLEAQKYRIEKIWKGDLYSSVGQAMINCVDNRPLVMCVTNVQVDSIAGLVAFGRLFSGTVKTGDKVFLVNAQSEEVVSEVSVFMGALREPVAWVSAGNLVALTGLNKAKAGETIVDITDRNIVGFESVRYVSDPVVTMAVEPKNPADLPLLEEALDKLAIEDPNLLTIVSEETGEYLLSGMGELHLEVSIKRLKENLEGIEIATSTPRVFYRESMHKNGTIVTAYSPNKQNNFTIQTKPLGEVLLKQLEKDKKEKVIENILAIDDYYNLLIDSTGDAERIEAVLNPVILGFKFACRAGPLCAEPLRGLRISINNFKLSNQPENHGPTEVMHGVGKAIFGSFLTGKPFLLEPVYKTIILAPTELVGTCTRILNTRDAKIISFEEKGVSIVIGAYIAVAKTFGLSEELRSATSGRAFWQSFFDHWERIPEKDVVKVIGEVRKRKGLPSEVPKPERFLEQNNES
jgi:elongation factor 2